MSSTEARELYPVVDLRAAKQRRSLATPVIVPLQAPPRAAELRLPKKEAKPDARTRSTPIIQPKSVAGRSLVAVIAIMSFLAALTLGVVVLVRTSAGEWQAQVSRELTVQVRAADGRDIEADVAAVSAAVRETAGVAQVRAYTREESAQLLEPWLGTGLQLSELPVPRLIVVNAAAGATPDLTALRTRLTALVPSATLDDHRVFVDRMRSMTRMAVLAGTGLLGLMMFATVLLVGFATRGAMASNHAIVEVLHFVGAKNRYIAGQFQRHFLRLGLRGAILGGGAAMAVFLGLRYAAAPLPAGTEVEVTALFGSLHLGPDGYAGICGVVVLVAAVAAMTSRWTVHRTLNTLDE